MQNTRLQTVQCCDSNETNCQHTWGNGQISTTKIPIQPFRKFDRIAILTSDSTMCARGLRHWREKRMRALTFLLLVSVCSAFVSLRPDFVDDRSSRALLLSKVKLLTYSLYVVVSNRVDSFAMMLLNRIVSSSFQSSSFSFDFV